MKLAELMPDDDFAPEDGAIEVRGDRWVVHADRLDDTRIPGTLRDVVRSKVDGLDPLERSVLEKAAAGATSG